MIPNGFARFRPYLDGEECPAIVDVTLHHQVRTGVISESEGLVTRRSTSIDIKTHVPNIMYDADRGNTNDVSTVSLHVSNQQPKLWAIGPTEKQIR
jgi:hypothetical protein